MLDNVLKACWQENEREMQHFGLDILQQTMPKLTRNATADGTLDRDTLPPVIRL